MDSKEEREKNKKGRRPGEKRMNLFKSRTIY